MTDMTDTPRRRLTAPQTDLLARLLAGEAVRTHQVHPSTLAPLLARGLVSVSDYTDVLPHGATVHHHYALARHYDRLYREAAGRAGAWRILGDPAAAAFHDREAAGFCARKHKHRDAARDMARTNALARANAVRRARRMKETPAE